MDLPTWPLVFSTYLEAEGAEEGEAPSSITDVYFARINRTAVKATEMRDAGKRILDSLSLSLSPLSFIHFIFRSLLSRNQTL